MFVVATDEMCQNNMVTCSFPDAPHHTCTRYLTITTVHPNVVLMLIAMERVMFV